MYLPKAGGLKKLCYLLLFMLAGLAGRAQIYPVEVSTQATPPYDVYLPDYASPGGEKLRIVLLQRDLAVQGYRLRFEMKIQDNGVTIMQTSKSAMPPPITLQPGIPTVLGGSDLSWYVQPQNLEFGGGYSAATYEQTRTLPEGPITITFTAYDYIRSDLQVSLPSSTSFYASLDNPPLLNYPACGMQVAPINPQFINFGWLPQNTSSPNSALQTNYVFSIWAVLPNGYNYQDIVQSAAPMYTTTVQTPNFVYGPAQPMLTPGQQYAWRVQAVDASGRDIFVNNGFSQTCNFIYGGDSSQGIINYPDIQINAAAVGSAQGKVWWTGDNGGSLDTSGYTQYELYYRASQGDNAWFSDTVTDTMYRLFNLEPNTAYECRIQGYKGGTYGPYSSIASFTTAAQPAVSCTDSVSMLNPSSGSPLASASPGMILTYGPWNVTLTTVQPVGPAGQFKGTCTVSIPFMGGTSFYATFSNLTIDDSRNVTAGNINFVSQSMQSFVDSSINSEMGGSLYGKVVSGTDTTEVTVPVSLANITQLPVTLGPDSTIASFTIPGNPPVVVTVDDSLEEVTIKDSTGSTYALNNQGQLTQLTLANGSLQNFFGSPANVAALDTLATGMGVVNFRDADSKYAFDAWQPFYSSASTILTGQYQLLTGGSGNYYVAQKAIGAGASDIVGVSISLAPGMTADSLVFSTGTGTQLIWDPTDSTLDLLGGPAADAQNVYALYPKPGGGYYSLGKLLVSAYEQQNFTAVLVPVVSGDGVVPSINAQQIADSLNSIYNKVNVNWTVVVDSAYNNVSSWDANGDGLLTMTGSSILSNKLVGEPAALMSGYMSQRSMDKTKPYLFVLNTSNGSTGDPGGTAGDMPRGEQYGFLFLSEAGTADQAAVVAAHELGHGQFNLEHTFSGDLGLTQGATDLMDYVTSNSRRLYKYQWGQIHQPGQVLGIFESDTAGQSMNVGSMQAFKNAGFFNIPDSSYTFFSPVGGLITLPKTVTAVRFWANDQYSDSAVGAGSYPDGTLLGFTLNGNGYSYAAVSGTSQGAGYFVNASGAAYVDSISKNLRQVTTAFLGLPCLQNGNFNFKVYQVPFDGSLPQTNTTAAGAIDSVLPIDDATTLLNNDPSISVPATFTVAQPYTQEALQFLNQNNSCGQLYTRYLLQAADLITANPGVYTAFKSCTGDSLVYPPDAATNANSLQTYRMAAQTFPDALKNYIARNAAAYTGIPTTSDPGAMDALLSPLCPQDYRPLTASQRIKILQVYGGSGNLQDSWGNNRENYVVNTISQTPIGTGQSKPILNALQANDYAVLRTLITGCDNQVTGVGNNNFDALINGLTILIQDAYPNKNLPYQYQANRILKWGHGFMGGGYSYNWNWPDGADSIEFDVTGGYLSFSPEESGQPVTSVTTSFNSLKAAPYDNVTLQLYSDVTLSSGATILLKSTDTIQSIPALYLYWILKTSATQSTVSTVMAAVNVSLFAVGAGELESAEGLELALAIADNSTLAGQFVLDAGLRNALESGPDSAAWRPIIGGFDAFSTVYGSCRLGEGLNKLATKLASRRALFNQLRNKDAALMTPAQQNALANVDNALAELESETGVGEEVTAGPSVADMESFLNNPTARPNLTDLVINQAGENQAAIYSALQQYSSSTLDQLETELGQVKGLSSELAQAPELVTEFMKMNSTSGKMFWYKYRLKYNQLSQAVTLPPNFQSILDNMAGGAGKTLGTSQSVSQLGKLFEDDVITNYIKAGQASQLPGFLGELQTALQAPTAGGTVYPLTGGSTPAFSFDDQLLLKLPESSGNVKPDIVGYVKGSLGGADPNSGIWAELKIDENSSWSSGQTELKDDAVGTGNGITVKSKNSINFAQGSTIQLLHVIQVSVDNNGLVIKMIK